MKQLPFGLLLVLGVSLVCPITARGQVPFSHTRTCVRNTAGFDDNYNPLPNPPDGFFDRITQSFRGTTVDNGDGTHTSTFIGVNVNLNSPQPANPVNVFQGTSTGPVTINPDGSVSFMYTSNTTTVAGGGVGSTNVTTGGVVVTLLDQQAMIGFAGPADLPTVETVTVTRPDGTSFSFQQVCNRSGSSQLIQP